MFPSVCTNPTTKEVPPYTPRKHNGRSLQGMESRAATLDTGQRASDNWAGWPAFLLPSITAIHATEGDAITWARFDDNYDSNPKIRMAGRDAKNLHETSIRWSCRLKTHGCIPKAVLIELGVLAQLPGNKPLQRRAAAKLVELNLWEDHGDEWHIHDFIDYMAPQRFVTASDRHEIVTQNHAEDDPNPTQPSPNPMVSLEELKERAIKRGVAPLGLSLRLADLQQWAEAKGARSWIPYVLKGFGGGVCLFDQRVSRWLEEDHARHKQAERDTPAPDFGVRLRRMEEA